MAENHDGYNGYERYERYEEPYSYEVRDRRVRIARGLMEEPYYERTFRDCNFSKREFILCRESVECGKCTRLQNDLDTAFAGFAPPAYSADGPAPYAAVIECIPTNEARCPFRSRDMAVGGLFAAKGMLPPNAESDKLG